MSDKEIVEREILKIIRKGQGEYGWYNIAQRMTNIDIPRIPGLRESLAELEKRGLITKSYKEGATQGGWDLTDSGRLFLES